MSEQGINFKITATAQLAALKQTEQQLIQQVTAAKAAGASFKQLEGDLRRLEAVQSQMKGMGFMGRLGAETMGMAQNIPILGRVMSAANGGAGMLSVGLAGLTVVAAGARAALNSFSKIEDIQTSFVTLLGSVGAAKERMSEISKFAAETPFEMPEVANASKILENLTSGALSTGAGLRMVGDVAAAANASFTEVAVTMGRLYQGMRDGTPVGEAAARMTELTGINLRQAKSWEEVAAALSKYNGEMERRSGTVSGKESNLADSINLLLVQLGRPIAPAYKGTLSWASEKLNNMADGFKGGWDAYERDQDTLARSRGEGGAVDSTKKKVEGLSAAKEDASDKAKRMKAAITDLVQPLEDMASAADRSAKTLERLSSAKEKLADTKIDADEASGKISTFDAARKRVATAAAYALDNNSEDMKRSEAELSKAQELQAAQQKKTDLAMMMDALHPSAKTKKDYEDAASLQAELNAVVSNAQSKVDALRMQRESIENVRDKGNLDITEKENKAEKENQLKRAELETNLKISNAVADGNKAEELRLRWALEYNAAREKAKAAGMGENAAVQFATDSANAGGAGRGYKPEEPEYNYNLSQSSLQAVGGAAGERATVTATLMARTNELLGKVVENTGKKPEATNTTSRFAK